MTERPFVIHAQPDETTCGPTCLHAVYGYYDDELTLGRVIAEVESLPDGGTLGAFLGCHALRRGYRATIYVYNLQLFDPTWFDDPAVDLSSKLADQKQVKEDAKLHAATSGYMEFLALGGRIRYEDLSGRLILKYIKRERPILTGLSATYLYRTAREYGPEGEGDDLRGFPVGHFVVLCGYEASSHRVTVADPYEPNPMADGHLYAVDMDRLVGAILLGMITYDANLLIIEPGGTSQQGSGIGA